MAKTLLNEPKAGTHSEAGHQARLPRCWFDEPMVEAAGVEPASETDGRHLLRAYSRVIVPGQAWRPT
jgi:hypothetical protein